MTSLDSIPLSDHQDLNNNEQYLINLMKPNTVKEQVNFSPLIIACLVTITAVVLNSDWLAQKLDNIPYYRVSLLGLLFSFTLFYILFLS